MLKVNSTDLAQALNFVCQALERTNTSKALEHVLLTASEGWLTILCSNGSQEIKTRIPEESGNEESFTVEAAKLKSRATQYPKDKNVSIVNLGSSTEVKCGRSKIKLSSFDSSEYPSSQFVESPKELPLKGRDVKSILSVVKTAQADKDVRTYLNGVNIELSNGRLDAVATDGHRMHHAFVDTDSSESFQCLVTNKSVPIIMKFVDSDDVVIKVSENHIEVSDESSSIKATLIAGKFPDWHKVIPRHNGISLVMNKVDLEQALKGCLVASNEKYKGVTMSASDGEVIFSAKSGETTSAEEVIDCSVTGGEIEIGVNGDYLLDAIACIESENVTILANDANTSMLIKDGNYQAVVMPMRL